MVKKNNGFLFLTANYKMITQVSKQKVNFVESDTN